MPGGDRNTPCGRPYREAYLTRDTLGVGHAAGASGPVSPPPLPTRRYTFCSTFSTPREGPAGTRRDMATGESSKRPRFLWTARQALVQRYCSSAGRGPQGGGKAGPPLTTASHDAALQRQPSSRCGTLKATQLCNKEADATCVPAAALAGACGGSRLPPAAALRPAPALARPHQPPATYIAASPHYMAACRMEEAYQRVVEGLGGVGNAKAKGVHVNTCSAGRRLPGNYLPARPCPHFPPQGAA